MKSIIVAAVLLLLGAGCLAPVVQAKEAVKTITQPISKDGIGALGRIEPRSRVITLSHDAGPEGARIEKLTVAEGQLVKQGEVIAIFSDYNRKQAKLDSVRAKIPMLEAKIKAETANKNFYADELKRVNQLLKSSAVSKVRQEEAQKNSLQSTSMVDSLRAELISVQADVNLTEQELKQSQVTAPMDGTILKIHAWQGERVNDKGVVEIADLTKMDVVAEIYERDMPRIKVGQQAEIKIAGFPDVVKGEVRELGFQVMKNDMNGTDPLADRDNRVVEVRITLDPAMPEELAKKLSHLIFMQVDVRLL
jgi:HlyD family secretion protein